MAATLRTLRGRVGTDTTDEQPTACSCVQCAASAPTTAAGAPPSPDFAQAVRDSDKPRPVTPKAVDRTKAPEAPSMIDYIKGGK